MFPKLQIPFVDIEKCSFLKLQFDSFARTFIDFTTCNEVAEITELIKYYTCLLKFFRSARNWPLISNQVKILCLLGLF